MQSGGNLQWEVDTDNYVFIGYSTADSQLAFISTVNGASVLHKYDLVVGDTDGDTDGDTGGDTDGDTGESCSGETFCGSWVLTAEELAVAEDDFAWKNIEITDTTITFTPGPAPTLIISD